MIWRGFEGTDLPAWLESLVRAGECGGIVIFGRNVDEPRQVWETAQRAAAAHGGPGAVVLAADQEGGRVARLAHPHFTAFPAARALASAPTPDLVRAAGRALGEEMAAVGLNLDLAPVLDVQEGTTGVIGDRSFGADPATVSRAALAWLAGLESAGIAGCAKHFPGHGNASCDSHVDLPLADGGLERIRERHLPPFRDAVQAGVRAVMAAHVLVPDLDPDRPASLSPAAIDGLLRGELGFGGVVVTDDLEMGAVSRGLAVADAALMAVRAGCDAILVCTSRDLQDEACAALAREADRSPAFRARIERSLARLDALASTLGRPPGAFDPSRIRSPEHLAIAGGPPW